MKTLQSEAGSLAWLVISLSLAGCRPDESVPTEGGGEPRPLLSYLARPGATPPIDLPAIDIDQPATPPAIETDDVALVTGIRASGGLAWVGFKDRLGARQRALRRLAPHPFKRSRTITTSRRPALSADAARRGLAAIEALGGVITEYYEQFGFALVRIDPATAPVIAADSTVDWIEPIPGSAKQHMRWSSAPHLGMSVFQGGQVTPWGVSMVRAPLVWPSSQGQGAKLLVLDGWFDASHPDLPSGFNCYTWCVDDGSGHGSGVLGAIVARNNTVGTVGVAPGISASQIYAKAVCFYDAAIPGGGDLKFPGTTGSFSCLKPNVVQELNWAAANLLPRGIVNMSFGWSSVEISYGMAQAAATAFWNGVLLVAAAGNLPSTNPPPGGALYPAAYSHVIGVSGVSPDSNLATTCSTAPGFGSNYGTHVELAAPFEGWAVHPPNANNPAYYDNACGTSFAAPIVAGVAALVWGYYPSWTNQRLREHLIASAIDRGPPGLDQNTGFGLVQATLTDVFAPPLLTGTTTGNPKRPRLTWNTVPAAGSYQIFRKVTPYNSDWALWMTTTNTSFTDAGTTVSAFFGYDAVPSGTSVSYYVTAVTPTGYQSVLYSRYATYVPIGTPPY